MRIDATAKDAGRVDVTPACHGEAARMEGVGIAGALS